MVTHMNRRRFLTISAAFAGAPVLGAVKASAATFRAQALGARVTIRLAGPKQSRASELFKTLAQELRRLENIFSLYRPESELSHLNRTGLLKAPSPELREVLGLSQAVHDATGGAFDPTIQPVWALIAASDGPPAKAALAKAWALTGFHRVVHTDTEVRLASPEAALTLNGIAQGYITDQLSAFLHRAGFHNVLIDAGEIRANGSGMTGSAWKIGISDNNGQIARRLTLHDRALATSSPEGAVQLPGGVAHILDTRQKTGANNWNTVSVSAENAALADALSTAFTAMTRPEIDRTLILFENARLELCL